MTMDTAIKSVDMLINNLKLNNQKKGSITFFGGEPMMMWDKLIVPVVEYVKNTYSDFIFSYSMTTNGTLLSKERIDYMKNNHFSTMISLDGEEWVQDLNRPQKNGKGSFNLIEPNLKYFIDAFPNQTMRATISHNSIDEIFNTYQFSKSLGFKSLQNLPDQQRESNWSEEEYEKMAKQTKLIMEDYLHSFRNNNFPQINYKPLTNQIKNVISTNNFLNNPKKITRQNPMKRCGNGIRHLVISYNGDIFGCHRQTTWEDTIFKIGNIYNGIDSELHQKLLEEYSKTISMSCENPKECDVCPLNICCKNGLSKTCFSANYCNCDSLCTQGLVDCRWQQIHYKEALNLISIMMRENNILFAQYCKQLMNNK